MCSQKKETALQQFKYINCNKIINNTQIYECSHKSHVVVTCIGRYCISTVLRCLFVNFINIKKNEGCDGENYCVSSPDGSGGVAIIK